MYVYSICLNSMYTNIYSMCIQYTYREYVCICIVHTHICVYSTYANIHTYYILILHTLTNTNTRTHARTHTHTHTHMHTHTHTHTHTHRHYHSHAHSCGPAHPMHRMPMSMGIEYGLAVHPYHAHYMRDSCIPAYHPPHNMRDCGPVSRIGEGPRDLTSEMLRPHRR